MSRKEVIVSMASVIAAAQSVAQMHQSDQAIDLPENEDTAFVRLSDEAVSSSQGQAVVRTSLASLASTIRVDDLTLSDRYAEVAGGGGGGGTNPFWADSVTAGGGFVSCYNNCHSACHGSRGWR